MISWVAMDRIVERKMASDAKYRKQAAGRPLRSDAKRLTDGELLAKLRSFGIDLDRTLLGRRCEQALSAEEITKPLLNQRSLKRGAGGPAISYRQDHGLRRGTEAISSGR